MAKRNIRRLRRDCQDLSRAGLEPKQNSLPPVAARSYLCPIVRPANEIVNILVASCCCSKRPVSVFLATLLETAMKAPAVAAAHYPRSFRCRHPARSMIQQAGNYPGISLLPMRILPFRFLWRRSWLLWRRRSGFFGRGRSSLDTRILNSITHWLLPFHRDSFSAPIHPQLRRETLLTSSA